jgi:hypothetical protein
MQIVNLVIAALREHIADQNIRFVFPSQVASDHWARKTCTLGIARSIAKNRFLAWDDFKIELIKRDDHKKKPVSDIMRRLFSEALLKANAEKFFLQSLVPPEYAKEGRIYAASIARTLPSLARWEMMMNNAKREIDAEDQDYRLIKNEYAAFLKRFSLFEPSWENKIILSDNCRYVLFFPELIEDFAEYDALLNSPQFVKLEIPALKGFGAETAPECGECLEFNSAREEIRTAAMELQRLHEEEGIPYEDMALSVGELEEMEPCLLKEFSMRHIPFTRRAGKKLGETGAGRFFSLVNECESSRFSFTSLKALILNDHIPWKNRNKNSSLISFGIKYNCVSGYIQDGRAVDIWEEAFKTSQNDAEKKLKDYYHNLKIGIQGLVRSKNFLDIKKSYFVFKNNFLDMEQISDEDDEILSRCIVELGVLLDLEEMFSDPSLVPSSPFAFFLSCLNEKEYVRANQNPGVNIFKWRVAAASPFSCHFVLNASQSAASVLYRPMKFLRQDKRKALGLEDKDASGAFFLLCDTGEDETYKCRKRFSASAQTFSGWAIPHSFFARGKTVNASLRIDAPFYALDPYAGERRFLKELDKYAAEKPGEAFRLNKIFPLQKRSYGLWKNRLIQKENNFSFFLSGFPGEKTDPNSTDALGELFKKAIFGNEGYLTVTPTKDLDKYYACSMSWLYERILKIEEYSLEASLLDDRSLGILYHKILQKLFTELKTKT